MERELQAGDPELEERMRHPILRWWTHYVIGSLLLLLALVTALAPMPTGTTNDGFFTVSVVAFAAGWFFGRARRMQLRARRAA